jgi:hypothetical protein
MLISIITPLTSGRESRIDGMVYNIRTFFKDVDIEIIFAEQEEGEAFKPGQLRNLGYRHSNGDVLVFFDIDMRLKNEIYLDNNYILNRHGSFISWKRITQIEGESHLNFKIKSNPIDGVGHGGCLVVRKDVFISSNGYSNLCIGWGKEDDLFYRRLSYPSRLNNEIYHIEHPKGRELYNVKPEALRHNVYMVNKDGSKDRSKDSFNHTIADISSINIDPNYTRILFKDIRVSDDFGYMDDYNIMKSFEVKSV